MALTTVGAVLTTGAGFTVSTKLVLAERLPGSVAVTTTVLTPLTEGVPESVVPTKLRPAGRPLAERLRLLGVCWSEKVLAKFRL
jgi:hypothetical protein